METIAVLGAGLLGSGMVENLLAKGERVVVWNRTASKVAPLVQKGAIQADTPADAARGAARVHLVLTSDDAVDATVSALLPGLGAGVPILDHSTNLPERVAERAARLRADGVRYFHAPVFMSPANAREASGVMMVAGPEDEVAALTPALARMTGTVWHTGPASDRAAVYKLLGNGAFISLSGVLGDLLSIGAAHGMGPADVARLFDVFKIGNSLPFMAQRVAKAGSAPASFELTMARKDVRLMIETAGGPEGLVVLPAVAAEMDRAIAGGAGEKDFAVFAWPRRPKA